METVIRNVNELNDTGRSAAETLVGHALAANQQLVIQVVEVGGERGASSGELDSDQLPSWCDVYAGLSDERVHELEQAISRRLDLTREEL
jgi:hypothetical protein